MSMYQPKKKRSIVFKLLMTLVILLVLLFAAVLIGWQAFSESLKPVSSSAKPKEVTIAAGSSVSTIGQTLKNAGVIRSDKSFQIYVKLKNGEKYLQAGTYMLSPSQSTQSIVALLTHGKVATELVTILPGMRIDQIRDSLIEQGFSESAVDAALEPTQYEKRSLLAGKPAGASLEGFLFPESYQKTADTTAADIVKQALDQTEKQLTPDLVSGFQKQGLTTYQAMIVGSIVEKEVVTKTDREQAAQVFLKRYKIGMQLGSDVTAFYGSEKAGQGQSVVYDTPYNTRLHDGLPPTPISNVSAISMQAVARPANTDWLFFVAGDDGTTYFSKTVEEHEALTKKYCHKLCQ